MLSLFATDFIENSLMKFIQTSGLMAIFSEGGYKYVIMICISLLLLYLAIKHKFEPLLLLPIAFGMLLTNLPGANMFHAELFAGGHVHWDIFVGKAGLIDYLYLGVKLGIYPCLIFVGVGAMTDFGPLIANPKSFLLGAAAQLGIFLTSRSLLLICSALSPSRPIRTWRLCLSYSRRSCVRSRPRRSV